MADALLPFTFAATNYENIYRKVTRSNYGLAGYQPEFDAWIPRSGCTTKFKRSLRILAGVHYQHVEERSLDFY